MLEFALLAPIFFFLLVGILDLGRAGFYFVAGSQLARTGARYAAMYNTGTPFTNAQVATGFMQPLAKSYGINSLTLPAACGTATPPKPPTALSACQTPTVGNMFIFIEDVPAAGSVPHYKKVSTVYSFRPVTPMLYQITGTIEIVATSAMDTEYP